MGASTGNSRRGRGPDIGRAARRRKRRWAVRATWYELVLLRSRRRCRRLAVSGAANGRSARAAM